MIQGIAPAVVCYNSSSYKVAFYRLEVEHMPIPSLTPDQVRYLLDSYRSGMTAEDIASELGIHWGTVYARLRRHGVPTRGSRIELPIAEIVALYEGGESENSIAKRFGVERAVIAKRLNEQGVMRRNMTEANRLMMSSRTSEENRRNAQAAHQAMRGRKAPMEERCKSALGRQRTRNHAAPDELRLAAMLLERGVRTIPQQAIGPYNCDLGAYPVAVEIFGGGWHWYGNHILRTPERFRYILDAGWHILVVKLEAHRHPLTEATADYIAAFLKEMCADPTRRREYRVVRGAGQLLASGGADDQEISIVQTLSRSRNRRP